MIFIGVDPGITGAVAAIDASGEILSLQDTPAIKVKKGKRVHHEYAEPGMAAMLTALVDCAPDNKAHVTIENVHAMPKQGVVSSFNFGVGYGIWRGIIAALGLPCDRVEPGVWKRALSVSSAKGTAVAKALRLFPKADIGYAYRGRIIYQDGRAEALLLAWYGLQAGPRLRPVPPVPGTTATALTRVKQPPPPPGAA